MFWGWEPRTFYEHDDAGRLVSSWVESPWDDEQRDLIIAEQIIRNLTGPNGEWMPEATADGADPMDYTSGYRYVPDGPHINWAEKTRKDAEDEHRKALGEGANMNGLYFTVEKQEF